MSLQKRGARAGDSFEKLMEEGILKAEKGKKLPRLGTAWIQQQGVHTALQNLQAGVRERDARCI